MTHLNDISKIYLEQISEKKDDSYLETDMKKRQKNNEKAIADMKKVKDDTVPRWMKEGAIADRLKAMAAEKKKDWDKKGEKAVADASKAMDKVKKTQKDMESSSFVQKESKKLDPVGQEDADIDNDGDVDKSDKYLHKKRKAIGKAIGKKKDKCEKCDEDPCECGDENVEEGVVVTKRKTLGSRFKNDAERQAYLKKLDQKSKERRLNKLRATVEEVEEDEQIDEQGMGYRQTARGNYVSRDEPGERDSAEVRAHNRAVAAYLKKRKAEKKISKEEVEQIDELRITKLADKSKVKERAKNIKSIRDKKAALSDLMKHYKGMKTGVYNSYEPEGEMVDEKIDVRKQSSKRKSLGRGSSINPDAKKTGYESPAEFRKTEKKLAPYMEAKNVHGEVEVPSGNIGKLAKKASKRIDTDVDGDVEHNDKHKGEYGEFVPTPDGKGKVFTGPKKVTKESFSNWRQDLIEVADEDGEKQIKEMPKNQKNKISINPKLGEAIENLGGTLIEEVEHEYQPVDLFEDIVDAEVYFLDDDLIESVVEEVILESLEEGYDLDYIIESIIESADNSLQTLNEVTSPAKVAALRARNKAAAASGEGQTSGKDAGSIAKARLQKRSADASAASASKTARRKERIEKVKSTAKKVGSAIKKAGVSAAKGAGKAGKSAVKGATYGAAYTAGSAVRGARKIASAAKKGYEAGRKKESDSTPMATTRAPETKSSETPKASGKARGGIRRALKKGLKAAVRGTAKVISTGAGAVKAGADYVAKRAGDGEVKKKSEVKAPKAKKQKKEKKKDKSKKLDDLLSSIRNEEVEQIDEKAVSKKQQRFMGMVYAAKKGEAPASAEVAKAAAGMSKKDAKDFASTKHKKLPEVKESMSSENEMSPQEIQLRKKSAMIDKRLASIRQRTAQKLGKN